MNNELLLEDKYKRYIKELITDFKEKKFTEDLEPDIWWDKLKKRIKKETLQYCRYRTINKNKEKRELEEKIEQYQGDIDKGLNIEPNFRKLVGAKLKLANIIESNSRGARIRAKIEEIEQDEKSTKYFYSKEHNNGERKQIRTLLKGQNIITEENDIIKETTDFYSKLYTSEGADNGKVEQVSTKIRTSLSGEQKLKLNKFISEDEIIKTIRAMKNNKSPGDDGLTKDFTKPFSKTLKRNYVKCLIT